MRKVVLFVLAILMLCGGAAFIVAQIFFASRLNFLLAGGAGVVAAMGAALLWEDFVQPLSRK